MFGGAFFRNHPTIVRKGTEYSDYNDEDTQTGPVNFLLHAGAAVHLGALTAMLLVHQNLDRDPVVYGPGIGFALSASIDPGSGGAITDPDEKLAAARARMRRSQARRDAQGVR